jgi:hypothetical protein
MNGFTAKEKEKKKEKIYTTTKECKPVLYE